VNPGGTPDDCSVARTLLRSCPDHDQSDTSYQRHCTEDRREGKGILSFVRDLHRACVENLFFVCEREPARCVTDDAKDDEEYSDDSCRLH
jgi:hypothetical protein